jgi:serine protease Do
MMKSTLPIFLLLLTATCTLGQKPVAKPVGELTPAVESVYPALVRIHVVSEEPSRGRMLKRRSSGSGTIISTDGYVLTNHHVAGKGVRITCRLSNRLELRAERVGTDIMTDLCVLKLDLSEWPKDTPLPTAQFGDSDKLDVGDTVLAMGSPAGLSQSVTLGIVSNTAMVSPHSGMFRLDGENVGHLVRWIGHDAVIYGGNSGGPLVNLEGEIIGVNEVGIGSLGGAIPGNLAKRVADELIAKGEVKRSWTGLETQPLLKHMKGQRGLLLAGVIEGSPAEAAGFKTGDVLVRFSGEKVHAQSPEELPIFNRLVLSTPVGATVEVEVMREGKLVVLSLTTEVRDAVRGLDQELVSWGITALNFTRLSALANKRETTDGVWVISIRNGGPSADAKPGLFGGDIITHVGDTAIKDIAHLRAHTLKLTADFEEPQPILILVERGPQKLLTVVKLGPEQEEDDPARARKPWAGVAVQVLTRDLATALDLKGKKGVRVTHVFNDSPAKTAGVEVGDVLLKLDGEVINARQPEDTDVLANMIREYRAGSEVELDIRRGGEKKVLALKLEALPEPASSLPSHEDDLFEFTARALAFADRDFLELEEEAPGVLISSVASAGWAELAGMKTGDLLIEIDGVEISSLEAFKEAMKKIADEKPTYVSCLVRRGIYHRFLELEPRWAR